MLPYVGPAAALPFFGALARLPWWIAVRVWSGLLAGSLGTIVVCALLLAGERRVRAMLAAFALALVSGPAVSALTLGQTALLAAAALAVALACFAARRFGAAVPAVFLAGLQPNLALALIARVGSRRAFAACAVAAFGFGAVTLAAGGGIAGLRAYTAHLAEHGAAERWIVIQHTPAAIAWGFGASPALASIVGGAIALVVCALLLIAVVRLPANDAALCGLALLPLAIPFFHEHDFVIALIPVIVVASRATGRARVLAGVAAPLVLVDWLGLAQRPPAQTEIALFAFAVACAFAALGRGGIRRSDAVPFAVVAATLLVALPLASGHIAPTWPDALPAHFHVAPQASIAQTWAAEQRAAGLEMREPAWAALRALPLAGSVLLAAALAVRYPSSPRRRTA